MIQIVIPKFSSIRRETHVHKCPLKHNPHKPDDNFREESNEVCGKELKGTGLPYHVYPCVMHLQDFRRRFGADTLIDAFLDLPEMALFTKWCPEKDLDEREATETSPDILDLNSKKRDI